MKQKNGQVLLLVIMLMATVITVVLSMSFQSSNDTKLAKLEEESQRALAAAEAGIEAAIKDKANVSFGTGSLSNISGFSGGATIASLTSEEFVTPLLQKNEQYTFYLSTPGGTSEDPDFASLTPSYTNKNLTVCFSSSSTQTAIEMVVLKKENQIKRYVVNPVEGTVIANALSSSAAGSGDCPATSPVSSSKYTIPAADIGTDSLLLTIRVINASSGSYKVGFKAVSGTNFPLQGKTISSQATSATGVSKKIELFQSYPQIPSDFFITNFNL